MGKITILRAGPLSTVQDLGRPGHRSEGVSLGGALDQHAVRIANLLVGNLETAALLEITLGGVRIRFEDERAIAWCGGDLTFRLPNAVVPAGRRALVRPEEELEIEAGRRGCRAWLAVAGGIDCPVVLGSRATDLRAGFGGHGGRALRDGDDLSLGAAPAPVKTNDRLASWSAPAEWARPAGGPLLRVVRGAEWEEFNREAQTTFLKESFAVTTQADRMGVRLAGPRLRRTNDREMLSEAVAPGTVQVANDGQPMILLGDCQTIGGYPRIAHVITVDFPRAAQLRPNDSICFREVSLAAARDLFCAREDDLCRFRSGLLLRAE